MPDEKTKAAEAPKPQTIVYVLKTEYFLAFEGTGRFEVKIPKHIDVVTSVSVEVTGKADYMDKVRFYDPKGTEFLAVPIALIMASGLFPLQSARVGYTKPVFFGFCQAPENVTVRMWGKQYSKVKQKNELSSE